MFLVTDLKGIHKLCYSVFFLGEGGERLTKFLGVLSLLPSPLPLNAPSLLTEMPYVSIRTERNPLHRYLVREIFSPDPFSTTNLFKYLILSNLYYSII